jgi:transketolase
MKRMWRDVFWLMDGTSSANDLDLLREAFDHFKKTTDQPTLIIVDSHIGYGAPTKQDTSAAHANRRQRATKLCECTLHEIRKLREYGPVCCT